MKAEEASELVLAECKRCGASDAMALFEDAEETMVRFSNDEITIIDNLRESSAYIFVYVEGRKAGTNVVDLSKRTLLSTTRRIIETAKRSPQGDANVPLPKGPFVYDERALRSDPVPLEARANVDWVRSAIATARKEGGNKSAGSLIARNSEYSISTTGEAYAKGRSASLEISLRTFGPGLSSGHSISVAASEKDFHPEMAGEEAGRLARMSANPVEGKAGDYQALLGPMVFADLMQQTGRFSSAFYVESGLSFLANKIGQQVASKVLTLSDDATLASTYGSVPFDHEGLPTKRTPIIEDGELKSYLHNSQTAKRHGVESTANAGLIVPQPFNLVVEPGRSDIESMIGQVDKGIYVTNNWYLRYQNYTSGEFSTIPRDAMFLIEDGKIVGSLRGLRMGGRLLDVLSGIESLSKERKWVKWWEVETPTCVPSALIDSMRFTRSTM